MRMSKSFAALAFRTDDAAPGYSAAPFALRRSSLDNLVIRGRTRLPSSRVSQPQPVDLKIAQQLLDAEARLPPYRAMASQGGEEQDPPKRRAPEAPLGESDSNEDPTTDLEDDHETFPDYVEQGGDNELHIDLRFSDADNVDEDVPPRSRSLRGYSSSEENSDYPNQLLWTDGAGPATAQDVSRSTSSTWPASSHRDFSGSSLGSTRPEPCRFVEEFNTLAQEQEIEALVGAKGFVAGGRVKIPATVSTTHLLHQHNFLTKAYNRTRSTLNLQVVTKALPGLRHRRSCVGNPTAAPRARANSMEHKSFEDLCRLGGLSVFNSLPVEYAAVDKFVLPSVIAACANYLVQHGRTAPGIFRLCGSIPNQDKLYNYFASRYHNQSSIADPNQIQKTVGRGEFPSHIDFTLNDVAGLFKKVLLGLLRGLLGSVPFFKALLEIHHKIKINDEHVDSDLLATKVRLIALAIASEPLNQRFYLITAVLGVVALIGHDSEVLRAQEGPKEFMGRRALAIILGPLLLGDSGNKVIENEMIAEAQAKDPANHKKDRKQKRRSSTAADSSKLPSLDLIITKIANQNAIDVAEMLMILWKDIAQVLRTFASESNNVEQRLAHAHSKYKLPAPRGILTRSKRSHQGLYVPPRTVSGGRHSSGYSRSSQGTQPATGSRLSSDSQATDWFNEAHVTDSNDGAPLLGPAKSRSSMPRVLPSPHRHPGKASNRHIRFEFESRTSSSQESVVHHGEDAPGLEKTTSSHPFSKMYKTAGPPFWTEKPGEYGSGFDNRGHSSDRVADAPSPEKTTSVHPFSKMYKTAGPPFWEEKPGEYGSGFDKRGHNSDRGASSVRHALLQGDTSFFGQPQPSIARLGPARSGTDVHDFKPRGPALSSAAKREAGLGRKEPQAAVARDSYGQYEFHESDAQLLADSFGMSKEDGGIDADRGLMNANIGPRTATAASERSFNDQVSRFAGPYSVKALAQRFSPVSQGRQVAEDPDTTPTPRSYARKYDLSSETEHAPPPVPAKDMGQRSAPPKTPARGNGPLLQRAKSDIGRGIESLIPSPVHGVGRGRKSRTPSPSKEPTPVNQARARAYFPSAYSDADDASVSRLPMTNAEGFSPPRKTGEDIARSGSGIDMVSTGTQWSPRHSIVRKAATTSSMRAPSPLDMLLAGGRPASNSFSTVLSEHDFTDRDRSLSFASGSDRIAVRHLSPASTSSTITAQHAMIDHLHRELKRKTKQIDQLRRNQEIAEETTSARERSLSRDGSEYWKTIDAEQKRRADEALAEEAPEPVALVEGPSLQDVGEDLSPLNSGNGIAEVQTDNPSSSEEDVPLSSIPENPSTSGMSVAPQTQAQAQAQATADVIESILPRTAPGGAAQARAQTQPSHDAITHLPPLTPTKQRSPAKAPSHNEEPSRKVSFAPAAPVTPKSRKQSRTASTTPNATIWGRF